MLETAFGNIYREANIVINSFAIGSRRILWHRLTPSYLSYCTLFNMSAIKLTTMAIVVAAFVAICKGEDSSLDIYTGQHVYLFALQYLVKLLTSYRFLYSVHAKTTGRLFYCSGFSSKGLILWKPFKWYWSKKKFREAFVIITMRQSEHLKNNNGVISE